MSNTTEALKKMVETSMESVRWGLIALRGQANDNLSALQAARSDAEQSLAKSTDALNQIKAQIDRTQEFLSVQEASLSAIDKAVEIVGGVKQ